MSDTRPSPFVNRDRKIVATYCDAIRTAAQDLYDDPFDTETAGELIDLLLHSSEAAREAMKRLNLYAAKS